MGPDATYDEDADLELGFTNTLTDETDPPAPPAPAAQAPAAPTPPAAPAPTQDATPAPQASDAAPEPNVTVDPFEGVSPAVREMLGDYQRLKTDFAEVRRVAGMVPGLQREIDRLKNTVTPPAPKPDASRKFQAVEKLRDEGLDDIAAALDEISAAIPQPSASPPPAAPAKDAPDPDSADARLDSVRPTWQQDLTSTEFLLWLSQQPAGFQNEMRSTADPDVIVKGLKQYDTFVANTASKAPAAPPSPQAGSRSQRLAAAVAAPRGVSRTPVRTTDVDDEEADMEAAFTGRATYQHTR